MFTLNRQPRTWLVFRIPSYAREPDPESTAWAHAEFVQELSPGHRGGTLARKLLTRDEAFAMAERLAASDGEGTYDQQFRYYPVEVGPCFYKTISRTATVHSKETID